MILTLMLLIIAATCVIVIIGFVMDRMAITQIKSGMRTLNKRVKRIEKEIYPAPIEGLSMEDCLSIKAQARLAGLDMEDVTYEAVDTKTNSNPEGNPETPEEDSSALSDETEG